MSKKKEQVGDGPATFYVTTSPRGGLIIINFDKPVLWVALTAEMATNLGEDLIKNAQELSTGQKYRS